MSKIIRFVDLFAGMGGMRLGFENACRKKAIETECVLTSEIKSSAVYVLKKNFTHKKLVGDISKIDEKSIPDFDVLCAGVPCQAFSVAGKRLGFEDTRGTLFFEVARILRFKKPKYFLIENVPGLLTHDSGRTLNIMISTLRDIGYNVTYKLLNSKDFGLAQSRNRIYIVGALTGEVDLEFESMKEIVLRDIITKQSKKHGKQEFVDKLLNFYDIKDLEGKSINDKRGGVNNIHSWEFDYKGKVSEEQKELLNKLLLNRRRKSNAMELGVVWKDGMGLSFEQISKFTQSNNLKEMLEDLVCKRYLKREELKTRNGTVVTYKISSGKLSFPFSKILDRDCQTPTLVATDMIKLAVVDSGNLRELELIEGLMLFGYPKEYCFGDLVKSRCFDLLGNTVAINVIEAISERFELMKD